MQEWKLPTEKVIHIVGLKRLSSMQDWFLILVLAGLASGVYVFFQSGTNLFNYLNYYFGALGIGVAHAADAATTVEPPPLKQTIITTVFILLGIVYIAVIWRILFTTHKNNLQFAVDTAKLLTGFFIGVAMSMFK